LSNNPFKTSKFYICLILDFIGSTLVAIGLAAYFLDMHVIPMAARIENYPLLIIVLGAALITPFIILMVRIVLDRLNI